MAKSGYFQITAFVRFFKLSFENSGSGSPIGYITEQLTLFNGRIIFLENEIIALLFMVISIAFLIYKNIDNFRLKKRDFGLILLTFWVVLSIIGVFAKKDVSGAYLPMIYPAILLLISYVFIEVINKNKLFKPIIYSIVILSVIMNVYSLIS